MIDRDLAELYGVVPKRLNEQVRRNIDRFPEQFRFQLTLEEKNELVANCDRLVHLKHSTVNPHAYTEQGIAMLSSVLHSDTAIQVSIAIMQAFVEMRKYLITFSTLSHRLDRIELKQLESDKKFEILFDAMESKQLVPTQGIFYDGQVFDAYKLVSDIVRSAKQSIVLIDNYIDDNTLTILSKKEKSIIVTLLTKTISKQLSLDIAKANDQYGNFEIKEFSKSHDRFLIIDDTKVYHLGASLKDLGKKWFAFSKMEMPVLELLEKM